MNHDHWMSLAIEQARRAISLGQSPFGSVIVRDGQLVAANHNEVWLRGDPTAHAEVTNIRAAAAALKSIDFSGCVLYSTCEPCPMCASAIHWAKLDAVYYGASIADAADAGFTELRMPIERLYEVGGSRTRVQGGLMRQECTALFQEWLTNDQRRPY
ncbi:MAG: nucleoside deaminase [Phycisphaerales bacterium]|nr:nucleoside deaminase [Phycisphaerales bacterium]